MTESWAEVKIAVTELQKRVDKLPPPPEPNDSWSEKVNQLVRTVHGMSETVNGRLEAEEMIRERNLEA